MRKRYKFVSDLRNVCGFLQILTAMT